MDVRLERYPLSEDVIECFNTLRQLDDNPIYELLFDPSEFEKRHSILSREEFTIEETVLRDLGVVGSQVRITFN